MQPKSDSPNFFEFNEFQIRQKVLYVPATTGTVKWGYLPNGTDTPVASMEAGSYLVVDALSHEGILEDQGRDPLKYFSGFGVHKEDVLNDAVSIARSKINHDFHKDGPHVVIGPIEIKNTEPGDILKIDIIDIVPRVAYGVISNRHGKGALPGEFPLGPKPDPTVKNDFKNVSIFSQTFVKDNQIGAYIDDSSGKRIQF